MRKVTLFVAIVACVIAVAGCKKEAGPTDAFKTWLTAIEKCEVESIKAGMTDESVTQFTQVGEQMKQFVKSDAANPDDLDIFKQMCKAFNKLTTITEFTETITGDEARVNFTSEGRETSAPMVRTEKGWKIDLSKMMREAFEAQMAKMQAAQPAPAEAAPEAAPAAQPKPAADAPDKVDVVPMNAQPVQTQAAVKAASGEPIAVPPPAPNSAAAAIAPTRFNPNVAQPMGQVQVAVPQQRMTAPTGVQMRTPGAAPAPATATGASPTTAPTNTAPATGSNVPPPAGTK